MDYRQELGIFVKNCPKLAQDAGKLFDVYWDLSRGKTAKIPQRWNASLRFADIRVDKFPEILHYRERELPKF